MSARPTEKFFYDLGGRLVGQDDANGNRTTRHLLAGTGHGGTEALVTAEFHADGGKFLTYYDVYGDARILRNELGQDETRAYDKMGRLTSQVHRGGRQLRLRPARPAHSAQQQLPEGCRQQPARRADRL